MQLRAITALVLLTTSLAPSNVVAQQARFIITVVDYDGRAVPDTQVIVYRVDSNDTSTRVASDTTNASGMLIIPVLADKRYRLRPSRPGYEFPGGDAHSAPPEGDIGIELRMRRVEPERSAPATPGLRVRYGTLTGQVVSGSGEPLRDESILARSISNPGRMYSGSTDADGKYVLSVAPDHYTVKAGASRTKAPLPFQSSPTYEALEPAVSPPVTVDSDAIVPVNFRLQPVASMLNLTVTALDDSGKPAEDTEIEAFGHRDPLTPNFDAGDFLATHHTQGESVQIGPTLPGRVTVVARSINREEPLAAIKAIDLEGSPEKVTLVMTLAARMSGRIDFDGRHDLLHGPNGIRLAFQLSGSLLNLNSVATKFARDDGTFDLRGLIGTGCLRLYGLPGGWRLGSITHAGRDITNRLITLEPREILFDVRVRLVRGQEPLGPPPACTQ